ncbi:MAG: class I SAM-dependent methyltransferase [Desulfamplus sp.]|nr:class I SAM-dependent methyltransferase [Desulfamplus sp.]
MKKKLCTYGYETDKGTNNYLESYEKYFADFASQKIHLLELGIYKGGSLQMWRDYFTNGTIAGLDIGDVEIDDPTGRIHVYKGLQQDKNILDKIRKETAPDGFDIIIDDASHIGELTRLSFWYLFDNHLKPGGMYVIEDWRTGYWDKWPDGKNFKTVDKHDLYEKRLSHIDRLLMMTIDYMEPSNKLEIVKKIFKRIRAIVSKKRFKSHNYGMVGFVKQLVDELGMDMITHPSRGSRVPFRESKFESMEILPGQIFIVKNRKGLIVNSGETG